MTKKNLYFIFLLAMIGSIGSGEPVRAAGCEGHTKAWCKLAGMISCFWNENHGACYLKKKCNDLAMPGECTGTMYEPLKCAWVGTGAKGKCLPKSSVKCNDLTPKERCTDAVGQSLNCAWEKETCKPMSEVPCENKNKAYCDKDKTNCFFYEPQKTCNRKRADFKECRQLIAQMDCEDWRFSYLNCAWTGAKCLLKSSIKCSDLSNEVCASAAFQSLKCAWLGKKERGNCRLKSSLKCEDLQESECEDNKDFPSLKCRWEQNPTYGYKGKCVKKGFFG